MLYLLFLASKEKLQKLLQAFPDVAGWVQACKGIVGVPGGPGPDGGGSPFWSQGVRGGGVDPTPGQRWDGNLIQQWPAPTVAALSSAVISTVLLLFSKCTKVHEGDQMEAAALMRPH